MGTTHYNLTQPLSTDRFNLQVWNDNLEQIDQRMYLNQTTTFNGATELVAGSVGNVPAPQTSERDKFLKGDGTWDEPSGASAVTDLTDVDLTNLSNGQILKFNGTTEKWENANESGGGGGAGTDEMTLDEYNALTTAQKNDGTIRFIPQNSSSGTETAVDMSSIGTPYCQSSMSITTTSSTETTVAYGGSTAIGCNFNYLNPIDVTNVSTITFKATNGSCYGGGAQAQRSNWNLQIGLTSTAIGDQALDITAGDSRWSVVADMPLSNHVYEETLDVSQLTGNYYLLVVAHGWNTVVEDITLHAGGAYPSQIKYMDKTYGISSGEGGSGDITIVRRTDNTNGYAWLTPCDANGNTLKPSEVTILSIFAEADMSGAPPYYNGLNLSVDTDGDRYCSKLYNTQTGGYAPDGTYSVDYTVAYIPNSGGSSGGGSSEDIYSTTEHRVGTWIDGSDIYERTVVISSAISQANYATIISGESIDLLGINSDGCFLTRSNGQRWSIFGGYSGSGLLIYQETNGDIMLYNNSGVDFVNATITVTYLK